MSEEIPGSTTLTSVITETVVRYSDLAASFPDVMSDPSKWFFYNDQNDTIDTSLGQFVYGPDSAPRGEGSVELSVSGEQRRNIATYQFSGTKLADITELRFSTYNPSSGNGGSANRSGYLNFNVTFDGSDTWQKRLAFVPSVNGVVVQDAWQEWDAIDGGQALWWWSGYAGNGNKWPDDNTSEYRTWSDLLASFPDIAIRTTDSWLGIRVGEPYSDGYKENIDLFKFGVGSELKIWDFEPEPSPSPTPIECIDGATWASTVESSNQGVLRNGNPLTDSARTNPASTLGANDGQFFSLGYGGSLVVTFAGYIVDVPNSPDLSFHEVTNGRSSYPVEKVNVSVSQDGSNWTQLGEVTNKDGGDGVGYLDLAGSGLAWIKYVQITDITNDPALSGSADGYDLDAVGATQQVCKEPVPPVTIYAHKVICNSESDLPNWGDDAGGQVTATTAQDYVNQSDGRCRLAEDWDFEWGYDGSAPKQSGEYVGYAGGDWRAFDVKTGDGTPASASITNPKNKTLWFREVLQESYIPFTYPPDASPGNNVSAEFYCNDDHYKYDNYESISNAQPGNTYYCVAFNSPLTNDVEICKADEHGQSLSGWTVGLATKTPEFSDLIPVTSDVGIDATLFAGDHVVFASGAYKYRDHNPEQNADSGFSYRPIGIPSGAGGWVSGNQLTAPFAEYLKLRIGGQDVNWGGYSPAHQYTTMVTHGGGNLNFSILDNAYSDNLNNGNFRAQVHQVVTTGVTEDDGCVTLEDVPYGDYVAFELPQDNWSHVSTMVNGQKVDTFPAPITVGERDALVTFENRLVKGRLTVQKTTDPSGDPSEFSITATGGGQVFESATGSVTDATDYTYTVEPQTYSVSEDVPEGWEVTGNNCENILVPSDGERVCEISNTKLYDIHGYKWNDLDGNGADDHEERLAGWEIFIDQNDNQLWDDGEPKTLTSDEDGDYYGWYWFDGLYEGTYEICEVIQDGWVQTYPMDPACHTVTLPDQNLRQLAVSQNMVVSPEYNFGNTQYGEVTVYKFADDNIDGIWQDSEKLLSDWDIQLTQGELIMNDTTDEAGSVKFKVKSGEYELSETLQDGWAQSGLYCQVVEPTPTTTPTPIPSEMPTPTPTEAGGCSDRDGDGICDPMDNCPDVANPDQKDTNFDGVGDACQPQQDSNFLLSRLLGVTAVWAQADEEVVRPNDLVVVNPGQSVTCYIGNYQKGSITGAKYFDANQNGQFDEGEAKMQYWGISLSGNGMVEQRVNTATDGSYKFTDLAKGTYTLCEEDRTSWGWKSTEPAAQLCRDVVIDVSGETETHNFGNFIDSDIYISKSNNAWPNDQQAGDEVTYTIRVMAVGGPVAGAEVFDLPPLPFMYVPGSFTAESTERGDLKGTTTTEPVYSSPGVWQLGDLIKDEIVTLTYKAKIGNTDPGIYPDMVWATGTSEQARAQGQAEGDLLAMSDPGVNESMGGVNFDGSQGHFGEDNFAGTQVAVVVDQTPSADHQVAVEIEETGSVLGASTELPATGGRFWVSLVAILTVLLGGAMIYLARKNRSSALAVALMLGLGLMLAPSAQAVTAIRIEQPYNASAELNQDASTNQRDMKIDFVVMNTADLSVTAQCQQSKDGGGWSDITTVYTAKAGGNSGYCEAKNLDNKSNYDFRVRVSGDGADQFSSTVRVGLDTDGPGTPINYGKSQGNSCEDVIKFTTADDNQTTRVDVYRSDNAEKFTANKDSRAALINIGPKTDHTLTTSKPDCQKTYFYVVRAFDVNGNGSGLVGDEKLTKVTVEGASGQTQTLTVGAVPVGSIAGGSTVNPLTGQSAGVTAGGVGTGEDGATADEDTQAAEGEAGSQVTGDETAGENGEKGVAGEEGSVLGETTGGGFFGWLGSLWQSFISWLKSLFDLN